VTSGKKKEDTLFGKGKTRRMEKKKVVPLLGRGKGDTEKKKGSTAFRAHNPQPEKRGKKPYPLPGKLASGKRSLLPLSERGGGNPLLPRTGFSSSPEKEGKKGKGGGNTPPPKKGGFLQGGERTAKKRKKGKMDKEASLLPSSGENAFPIKKKRKKTKAGSLSFSEQRGKNCGPTGLACGNEGGGGNPPSEPLHPQNPKKKRKKRVHSFLAGKKRLPIKEEKRKKKRREPRSQGGRLLFSPTCRDEKKKGGKRKETKEGGKGRLLFSTSA